MTEQSEINLMTYIVDKQFEMIGEDVRYEDIPDSGEVIINKKKMKWWDCYLFSNKEQYEKWKDFAIKELTKHNLQVKFDLIDMTYGLNYKNVKGQLEIF